MFYQRTIKNLRADLKEQKERADDNFRSFEEYYDQAAKLGADLEEARLEIRGYDEQVAFLTEELARNKEINEVLADTNQDQSRRLELLTSVLGQLNIVVKLPAKGKK